MSFTICIIGCGHMAQSHHGPACKRYEALHPDVRFAACCDIDPQAAERFGKMFDLPRCYTDIDAMLEAERPDAVCLIAPEKLTAELSCNILAKGFSLIMEKPPGMNSRETQDMIRAAQEGKALNQVAFNRRYMPLVQKLRAELEKAGDIRHIQYRMLRANRRDEDFSTTAIHGVDLVRAVAGSDYQSITFDYQELEGLGKGVANIHMNCRMASGALAHLHFLPVSGANAERLEIVTEKGLFLLDLPYETVSMDGAGRLLHYLDNRVVLEVGGLEAAGSEEGSVWGGFYHENVAFFDNLRQGRPLWPDLADSLQSVEVAEYIRHRKPSYADNPGQR